MQRFSMKELAKKAPVKQIIPQDYKELKNAVLIHETEKAYRIEFVLENTKKGAWFPKDFVIKSEGKYYAAEWIINKNII